MSPRSHAFASLALSTLVACSSEPVERAPLASDLCGKQVCTMPPRMGARAAGSPATGSDAGAEPAAGEGESVSLELVAATRADASQTRALGPGAFEVVVDANDGTRSEFDYDGGAIEIDGLGPAPYWFRLRPKDPAQLLTTLVPLGQLAPALSLPVFERQVFEDVADNLSIPELLDPLRGHAVLLFTRNALPLAGVSVAVSDGRVAYDSGTLFTDGVEQTQEHGAAALLNVPAVPFPGGSSEVEVTFAGETAVLEIELCRDAVTLVSVSL